MSKLRLNQEIIVECKSRLLQMKKDLLNRVQSAKAEFTMSEKTGDEIDLTVAQLQENTFLLAQERMRHQLLEIEFALGRIENGTFGICEETDEPIEIPRLLTLPATRLSIEGAEIRENFNRRFAKQF